MTQSKRWISSMPARMNTSRMTIAPRMPQNRTRYWYIIGMRKKRKITTNTKMLSIDNDFSIEIAGEELHARSIQDLPPSHHQITPLKAKRHGDPEDAPTGRFPQRGRVVVPVEDQQVQRQAARPPGRRTRTNATNRFQTRFFLSTGVGKRQPRGTPRCRLTYCGHHRTSAGCGNGSGHGSAGCMASRQCWARNHWQNTRRVPLASCQCLVA